MWLFQLLRRYMGLLNISKSNKFSKAYFYHNKKKTGFTLIEVIVVVSMLMAIGALVVFINFNTWRGYAFRGECDLLTSVLQKARNQSINNICLGSGCIDGRPHGVAIRPPDRPNKYVIFQGNSYTDPAHDFSLDEVFDSNENMNIQGIGEVVFSQLSGEASFPQNPGLPEGNIILNETNGFHSETISINNEGRISW